VQYKNLNMVQGKKKYHVEVSNRFAALEDLDMEVEINSAYKLLDQRKQAKLQ
jgi:hypothetical protein